MIVMDLEMSGLDPVKCGIWQIGAVDLSSGETFFGECSIDPEDVADPSSLEFLGKTEEELRGFEKGQKELLEEFLGWCSKTPVKNFVCQNFMDMAFIWNRCSMYGLDHEMHFRAFDLHSVAQEKYSEIHDGFLIDGDHSGMNLSKILEFVGMVDDRGIHNALEDAKIEAEAFNRITQGKGLFPEYKGFEIPEYLKK